MAVVIGAIAIRASVTKGFHHRVENTFVMPRKTANATHQLSPDIKRRPLQRGGRLVFWARKRCWLFSRELTYERSVLLGRMD